MRQRILNGFDFRAFGCFVWLNAYGFGVGVLDEVDRQFIVYRQGRKLVRG